MEHPRALADGGGTYRWHAGAPPDEAFARAVAELEARLAERCAALGVEPPALEPVEPEAPARRARGRARVGRRRAREADRRDTAEYVVEAYGEALLELGAERGDLVVLDADLASDCRTRAFELAYPDRFVQCGIAEQDMVSTAAGMARHGLLPVVNSFALVPRLARERADLQPGERGLEGDLRAPLRRAHPGGPGQVAPERSRHLAARGAPERHDRPAGLVGRDAGAPSLGGRGRGRERRAAARDRPLAAAARASRARDRRSGGAACCATEAMRC